MRSCGLGCVKRPPPALGTRSRAEVAQAPFLPRSRQTARPRRYVSVVGKSVLVISTVEHADDVLRAHVGEADTIKVVVPVVRQGPLDDEALPPSRRRRLPRRSRRPRAATPRRGRTFYQPQLTWADLRRPLTARASGRGP